jgi:hypothetical protein
LVATLGEELAEFQSLSVKVSDKTATEAERARWRALRGKLAPQAAPTPPPPTIAGFATTPPSSPSIPGLGARQHARTTTRKLKVAIAPVSALHATFTEEVSPGGLKLRLPMHVEPGAPMLVRLELGGTMPLTVNARVAWCRRDGGHYLVGLAFVGLRDDERDRIEAWTNSISGSGPGPTTAPK